MTMRHFSTYTTIGVTLHLVQRDRAIAHALSRCVMDRVAMAEATPTMPI